jgi:hypothetical protein
VKATTLLFAMCLMVVSSGYGQEKHWFVSEPKNLSKEAIANDVWHWYHMDALEPLAIQRVEWNSNPALGSKKWGYFIYYKGRLKDSNLAQSVKKAEHQWEKYPGLPTWSEHVPEWWTPESVIPSEIAAEVAGVQGFAFAKVIGDDVVVFCIKKPLDDAILQ